MAFVCVGFKAGSESMAELGIAAIYSALGTASTQESKSLEIELEKILASVPSISKVSRFSVFFKFRP